MSTPIIPTSTVIMLNGKVIGGALGLTIAISRQKLPVYTLGRKSPQGFGRGRRIITGTLQTVLFSEEQIRQAYYSSKLNSSTKELPSAELIYQLLETQQSAGGMSEADRLAILQSFIKDAKDNSYKGKVVQIKPSDATANVAAPLTPVYLDEIKGVELIIFYAQEDGSLNKGIYTKISDAQFMSEGHMITIENEAVFEEVRFTARNVIPFVPLALTVTN